MPSLILSIVAIEGPAATLPSKWAIWLAFLSPVVLVGLPTAFQIKKVAGSTNNRLVRMGTSDVIAELLLIVFPFSIYFLVGLVEEQATATLLEPETSVAASVLFGTTAVRLHRLLRYVPESLRDEIEETLSRSQAQILFGLLVSVALTVLIKATAGPPLLVAGLQGSILVAALRTFVTKGIMVGIARANHELA